MATRIENIDTSGGQPVSLPAGFPLSEAGFTREGSDLVVTAPDGDSVVIEGFFSTEAPPALTTPEGAQISGPLATRLAGPLAPEAEVLAGTDAGNEPIGTVNTVSGRAFVIRADGSREEVALDTPLFPGDILETTEDGALGVVLADETTFAMGADGRMVLDEMIYDPATQEGSLSLSVMKGVYTFVSGMISKTDPDAMLIDTPVGSIGIRGTQIGIDIADGKDLTVVMMQESDGYVGEVFVRTEAGVLVINQANQVLFSKAVGLMPTILASVDDATLVNMFEKTLLHLPRTTDNPNDYGTQEASGGDLEEFVTDAGTTEEEPPPPPEEPIRVTAKEDAEAKSPPAPEVIPAPVPEERLEPPPIEPPPAPAATEERREEVAVPVVEEPTEPVIHIPVVSVSAASGAEDTAIPINVSVSVASTGEIASVTIGGLPEGATLSTGTDNGDGTWSLASDQLAGLTMTPPADWADELTLSVIATTTDGGTASADFGVTVTSVPDVPVLSVTGVAGPEDTAIPLSISATVEGTEELASLIISGVPEGATLSAGGDNGDGTWTLAGSDLAALGSLTLIPPADWFGDLSLSVSATSSDGGTSVASFSVGVGAVADLPVIGVTAASGAEDSAIPLTITADVPGTEEIASVTVSGVPEGAALSAGTDNGDGSWTLTAEQLAGLTMNPPADWSGDMALSVTATSTDGGTAEAGLSILVTAVPDVPVIGVTAVSGSEDTTIPLAVTAEVPGTEAIASLTISGIPAGAELSLGTDNGDGSWTITGADLDALDTLTLTPALHSSDDLALSLTATSTDGATATAGFTVGVTAVADQPVLAVDDATYGGGIGGPPGDDTIKGTGHDDVLVGGGGDDIIRGKGGADVLYGDQGPVGAATVPLDIQASLTDVDLSETLSIAITGVPDGAILSAGVDNGDGSWTLTPDQLSGLSVNLAEGYQSDFALQVTAMSTDIDVDSGITDQTATSGTINVTFEAGGGEGGDDALYGGGGDDILYGGGGDDLLKGEGGEDVLYGGAGEDELRGGGGEDELYGGAGDDELRGEGGEDVLYGGAGDDLLKGEGGEDVLTGGAGDDVLIGGGGEDTFVFGTDSGQDLILDYKEGEELRFEGPEFSEENMTVSRNDDNSVSIMFEGQDVAVTLSDADVNEQSYTCTRDADALVITFDEKN